MSIERPGSILIFPKVVHESTRDTLLQISNTGNMVTGAHCFYLNGALVRGRPLCQVTDFELTFTRQQPTSWQAGEGRDVDPIDSDRPSPTDRGLDPGRVPPVAEGFTGALVCVEIDPADGTPIAGDHLKGEATIANDGRGICVGGADAGEPCSLEDSCSEPGTCGSFTWATGKYNGIGVPANPNNAGQTEPDAPVLEFDNDEYAACPDGLQFEVPSQSNAGNVPEDFVLSGLGVAASRVDAAVSLIPCNLDFENAVPTSVTYRIRSYDEFEVLQSLQPLTVNCWQNLLLEDTEMAAIRATPTVRLVLDATSPANIGLLGVVNVLHTAVGKGIATASDLSNPHFVANGTQTGGVIRVP
jgi:hypothetical protein